MSVLFGLDESESELLITCIFESKFIFDIFFEVTGGCVCIVEYSVLIMSALVFNIYTPTFLSNKYVTLSESGDWFEYIHNTVVNF